MFHNGLKPHIMILIQANKNQRARTKNLPLDNPSPMVNIDLFNNTLITFLALECKFDEVPLIIQNSNALAPDVLISKGFFTTSSVIS